QTGWPFIIYESPQRLNATLDDLLNSLGDRSVSIGRELTKLHEEVFRGTLSEAREYFGKQTPRGEVTIMIGAPTGETPVRTNEQKAADLDSILRNLEAQRLPAKEAARQAAALT